MTPGRLKIWNEDASEWQYPPGGTQPGAVRRLDLGVVDVSDFTDGPVILYTPDAGEIVGPVYLYDTTFCDNSGVVVIGRDEQIADDANFPPLAAFDSDLSRDGAGLAGGGVNSTPDMGQIPLTTGPVVAGFGRGGSILTLPMERWQPLTLYAEFTEIQGDDGHSWVASPGGTSGATEPDFAANEGGSVADGGGALVRTDQSTLPTVGSAHVYADVTTPAAP